MTRDEGWQFLVLGRCIERADMTSRLVATAALAHGHGAPWTSTLRACGGYEAFLRTYKGLETDRGAAEFLLLDRLFPRSVVFALNRAEQCLDNLEATGQRAGFHNEAQRLLGRTRAELEYRSLSDVVADLPTEMERLQRTCAQATEAVTRRFFATSEATNWQGSWHEHPTTLLASLTPHRGPRMSMQLRIVHTTQFEYDGKAVASRNQARLTPQTMPGQIVVHRRIQVSPSPWTYEYRDYFGNEVTAFEVLDPHESMTVSASSTVHVLRSPAADPLLGWADLAAPEVADRWTEYLALPPSVVPPEDLADLVRAIGADAPLPGQAARAVCALDPPGRGVPDRVDGRRDGRRRGLAPAGRGVPGHGAPGDRRAPDARHPGALRVRLPAPEERGTRRRDLRGRVARLGGVVGRRLAPLRPDQRPGAG